MTEPGCRDDDSGDPFFQGWTNAAVHPKRCTSAQTCPANDGVRTLSRQASRTTRGRTGSHDIGAVPLQGEGGHGEATRANGVAISNRSPNWISPRGFRETASLTIPVTPAAPAVPHGTPCNRIVDPQLRKYMAPPPGPRGGQDDPPPQSVRSPAGPDHRPHARIRDFPLDPSRQPVVDEFRSERRMTRLKTMRRIRVSARANILAPTADPARTPA